MIHVVGGGLAGSEAAWQLAERGHEVTLWEMRPEKPTPAHHTGLCAELVCSNSLGSKLLSSGAGLLKQELRTLDSLIIAAAEETAVPAGGALAVDREAFGRWVTDRVLGHPRIRLVREECIKLPEGIVIVAAGPLASNAVTSELQTITNSDYLHFFDAAAPIITGESILYDQGFWAARYDKGTADYFNCPMTKEEYLRFYDALVTAERAPLGHAEDSVSVFEGCMPVEVMAGRGVDTLRFGPMRPVGLRFPDGSRPYAVVQLRRENTAASLFNLVGFQTRLKWGEQQRVFRLIPALARAEFVRFGVMHRNTFVNAPRLLKATYQLQEVPNVFVAGQLAGVEGYVESASSGLVAALNADRLANGQEPLVFPEETMTGALAHYLVNADPKSFQPMKANFGILPPLAERIRDKQKRKESYSHRALAAMQTFRERFA